MSRRGSELKLSFFAFQDIITAVTGIMLLIVLMLSLELNPESEANDPDDPNTPAVPLLDAELLADVRSGREDELQAEVAALRRELEALASLLDQQSTSTPEDLADLERQLLERQAQLRVRQREAADELAAAERDARSAAASLPKPPPSQAAKRRELERRRAELREQASRDDQDERIIYELPGGSVRFGWIVVVDRDGFRVAPVGKAARPQEFSGPSGLISWASGREDEYILLLAKPSGVEDFDTVREKFDRSNRLFGYDLIPEDRTVLDPEKGAGR